MKGTITLYTTSTITTKNTAPATVMQLTQNSFNPNVVTKVFATNESPRVKIMPNMLVYTSTSQRTNVHPRVQS